MKTFILAGFVALVACGCTTTGSSRAGAARLAKQVAEYRAQQENRVESLNREYQRTFSRLIDDFRDLENQKVEQGFTLEAMAIADQLAGGWKQQTQPRQFRDTFQRALEEHFVRVAKAEQALALARAAYAEAYKDAVLQLKLLDEAKASLDKLATTPRQEKEIASLLRALYDAYRKSEKNADKNGGKAP
jgi:hypothetical protein